MQGETTARPSDGYDHAVVEAKWQARWEDEGLYRTAIEGAQRPFYNLMMFPYPSAEGLHVGHLVPYSGGDIYGRWRRLKGDDVFEPMGFDAFGIHSENYALKIGEHPRAMTQRAVRNFRDNQMKRLGTMFDWSRQVLALADGSTVVATYYASSGKPSTPTVFGTFHFYLKAPGTNAKGMYDSNYFARGYAVHGYPDVPTYAASHGCIRVPNADAPSIFGWIRLGDPMFVYR